MATQPDWPTMEKRWSADGKNLKCPLCGRWVDALLIRERDNGLCCWSCLRQERQEGKAGDVREALSD